MGIARIEPPKTARGRRIAKQRQPQVNENERTAIFIKGGSTSNRVSTALRDLYNFKKPHAVLYRGGAPRSAKIDGADTTTKAPRKMKRKYEILPFDDVSPMEKLSHKLDASLFCLARHSKKKPDSLIFGRMFDWNLLDMFEFTIENMTSMSTFKNALPEGLGIRPLLIFNGDDFTIDEGSKKLKEFLQTFFGSRPQELVSLQGVKLTIHFFLRGNLLMIRPFSVKLLRSGTSVPRVELLPIGPEMDLTLHRFQLANDDLYKETYKVARENRVKKVKNVSMDPFKSKMGRVHMERQDYKKLELRKVKGYKQTGKTYHTDTMTITKDKDDNKDEQ